VLRTKPFERSVYFSKSMVETSSLFAAAAMRAMTSPAD
jgi:hypothetical protein